MLDIYKDKKEIVLDNIRLVGYIVNRLAGDVSYNSSYDKEDLIQIGTVGLIKAANTYNGSTRFSTYAVPCIANEIKMFFRKSNKYNSCISLNSVMFTGNNDEDEVELVECIEDSSSNFVDELLNNFMLEKCCNIVLNMLSVKETIAIIYSMLEKKQIFIAEILNVSQTQVSRIVSKTKKKIKNNIDLPIRNEKYKVEICKGLYKFYSHTDKIDSIVIALLKQNSTFDNVQIVCNNGNTNVIFKNIEDLLEFIIRFVCKINENS